MICLFVIHSRFENVYSLDSFGHGGTKNLPLSLSAEKFKTCQNIEMANFLILQSQ